jgi:hypothetical protein
MDAEEDPHAILLQRLDSWLELGKTPFKLPLLTHMGMTLEEFCEWRQNGTLPTWEIK